jgi:hypothetical protein
VSETQCIVETPASRRWIANMISTMKQVVNFPNVAVEQGLESISPRAMIFRVDDGRRSMQVSIASRSAGVSRRAKE